MSRWEIKVYGYGIGHMYTMHSDSKLSSVKQNMARRLKLHINAGVPVASIAIRDTREESMVHIREILKSGKPKYRVWEKINYSTGYFPTHYDWDNSYSSKFKSMELESNEESC